MSARRAAERVLLGADGRATNLWAAIGKSTAVAPSDDFTPNTSLDYPLWAGAQVAGLATSGLFDATEDDLAALDPAKAGLFIKGALLVLLETIVDNWSKPSQSSGGASKSLSDIPSWVLKRIEQLREDLANAGVPGYVEPGDEGNIGGLSAGVLDFGSDANWC